ncbi:MAG: CCA tRNA nucleotidyltransferase [Thermoproteota archaeon]
MEYDLQEVVKEVLRRVKPGPEEEERVKGIVSNVVSSLQDEFRDLEPEAEVLLEGSIAKDTWLSGEADADIFIRFPVDWKKDEMGKALIEKVKEIFKPERCRLRFAEHPYITVMMDEINIDIVPCYKVKKGLFRSATDRTPFHTEFVKERLGPEMKDEVRLLKRFFKGIGVYGAEIKTRGFSGFLVELLIYCLGGFVKTLEILEGFKPPLTLDPNRLYSGREGELSRKARGSLLCVIDPVDELRNVAAAVSGESLSIAQYAAYMMLKKPSLDFFYPSYNASRNALKETIRSRELNTLSIIMPIWTDIPDILWGQAYRLLSRLSGILEENEFEVFMERAWSDEEKNIVLFFILGRIRRQAAVIHMGPPFFSNNLLEFVKKYLKNERTLVQPFPRNGRWWVILKPKVKDAREAIFKAFSSEEFLKAFPEPIMKAISEATICSGEGVVDAVEDQKYVQFLERCINVFPWISREVQ